MALSQLVVVVEDDESIIELLEYNLLREGFRVECVRTGEEALSSIKNLQPDLVLLDLMLPGMNGLAVCNNLKKHNATENIPIIMVTAMDDEADIIKGLELGADDYITKPFSIKVLIARVRALLRRSEESLIGEHDILSIEEILIHPGKRQVMVNEMQIFFNKNRVWIITFSCTSSRLGVYPLSNCGCCSR
ncbi:MAG: response regulator [Candidatus Electryonea clarkiae]|nr:response regulator [Candidatus Electryonea clarkiae]MDP8288315.1 response regulator [Candidatus Electryonea clarkiae]